MLHRGLGLPRAGRDARTLAFRYGSFENGAKEKGSVPFSLSPFSKLRHPRLFQEDAQNLAARRVPQLSKRLRFNLTNALSGANTPMQALVLLNDPSYVEAARAFAELIVAQGGPETSERIEWAWRQALSRPPTGAEARQLAKLYEQHKIQLTEDPAAAKELLAVGDRPVPEAGELAEIAAWTSVARVLFNLHESITRF